MPPLIEPANNNDKIELLNGHKVNIVTAVAADEDEKDLGDRVEVKSVTYRELVRQSKNVCDEEGDDASRKIR